MRRFVGLDFGTTNSALAVAAEDGTVGLATFAEEERAVATFRSILYGDPADRDRDRRPRLFAGPEALQRYLAARSDDDSPTDHGAPGTLRGRLIQSLKSHLASPHFTTTNVFGAVYTLEALVARIVERLRRAAQDRFGDLGGRVRVGRPVRFVGAERDEDDALAEQRLRRAVEQAGFSDVGFEIEPVAAAYRYGLDLKAAETVLIADLGGGTSDFSLIELEPAPGGARRLENRVLGTAGVAIGGDTFDGRIVHHLVAPRLGSRSTYRTPFGRDLPMPAWIFKALERWHHLSFLREAKTMYLLAEIRRTAKDPVEVRGLEHVIEANLGFELYRAVEQAKHDLSDRESTRLKFLEPPAIITADVTRAELERWIQPDLAALDGCVQGLLQRSGVAESAVDRVFMTGGSSLVPAVRALFERRFGGEKLRGGDELTSVAEGLALRESRAD